MTDSLLLAVNHDGLPIDIRAHLLERAGDGSPKQTFVDSLLICNGHHWSAPTAFFSGLCASGTAESDAAHHGLGISRHSNRFVVTRRSATAPTLFYASRQCGTFVAASNLRSLLGLLEPYHRTIDEIGLAERLRLRVSLPPRTLLQGVAQLPPGFRLELKRGEPKPIVTPLPQRTHGSASRTCALDEALCETLAGAVQKTPGPYGIFLSGGLDSNLVLWAFRQVSSAPIVAYTAAPTEAAAKADEMPVASATARYLGAMHRPVPISSPRTLDEISSTISRRATPYGSLSPLPFLFSAAQEDGITTILDGTGGDELFLGYRQLDWAVSTDSRQELLRRYAANWELVGEADLLRFYGESARAPLNALQRLTAEIGDDPLRLLIGLFRGHFLHAYQNPFLLWEAANTGQRVVCPLQNPELVRMVDARPIQENWDPSTGRRKGMLRDLAKRVLPRGVAERKKSGLRLPIERWARTSPMRSWLEAELSRSQATGFFSPEFVKCAIGRFRDDPSHYRVPFALAAISHWCLKHGVEPKQRFAHRAPSD